MAARRSTRVTRKYKTKYRVTNWQEYERGPQKSWRHRRLVFRGGARSLDTAEERPPRWPAALFESGIVTALTLRMVFHLPLRQTEGFLDSLLRMMEIDLNV